jgi:pimeloyl-ACP methyl ester carboxylesterase
MPYATVNGVRLYYGERGSGTPILGLHGAGSSAVFWEDAADRLSELGRAITYDRRGSNRSERPDPYDVTSVQEHADDALALLRELDAEPAILVGRSYGGTVALDLALREPASVLGVALLEAGPTGLDPGYDAWFSSLRDTVEQAAAERGVETVGEAVLREVFGAWEELPDVWQEVFTANGQVLLAELRGGETTDTPRLGELRVPAVVVTAEDSPAPIRSCSEALARSLPQARHVLVGGGHAIDPAGPDVLRFVREFLGPATPT